MAAKIIVSYDGTDSDRDALALGRLLAGADTTLALAYVRHAPESGLARERLAENDAETMLAEAAAGLNGDVSTHVLLSGSTSEGLRTLALETQADLVVFGSEYRTAPGHVDPQATARRLIDGGPIAIALAPSGFTDQESAVGRIAAIDEGGDPCVGETAEALAARLGAVISDGATSDVGLLVIGSKPGTVTGRIRISAAAEYLIELARCPVLVLPRGVAIPF
jgi:nucleotide-binding universal stress UspA family protein